MKKSILNIILLIVLTIFFMPLFTKFTISNGKTGDIVFCDNPEKYEEFYIKFIHSANRTPVFEYYKEIGGKFVAYKTTFYSYGAGMPDGSDNPNAEFSFKNGQVQIDNINKELDEFTVFVGTYADHTLHVGNESFKLKKYIEPQNPAIFSIKKVSIYTIIRRFVL